MQHKSKKLGETNINSGDSHSYAMALNKLQVSSNSEKTSETTINSNSSNYYEKILAQLRAPNKLSIEEVKTLIETPDNNWSNAELDEIYLEAVKNNYTALMIIPKDKLAVAGETKLKDELIFAALVQNYKEIINFLGTLLGDNPDINRLGYKTLSLIVEHYGLVLENVDTSIFSTQQRHELYLKAVTNNPNAIKFIPENERANWYNQELKRNWRILNVLPEELLKNKIQAHESDIQEAIAQCKEAIKKDWNEINHVPEILLELDDELLNIVTEASRQSVIQTNGVMNKVPEKIRNDALYLLAVQTNVDMLWAVPAEKRTYNILLAAVLQNPHLLKDIKSPDMRSSLTRDEYVALCKAGIAKDKETLNLVHEDIEKEMHTYLDFLTNLLKEISTNYHYLTDPIAKNQLIEYLDEHEALLNNKKISALYNVLTNNSIEKLRNIAPIIESFDKSMQDITELDNFINNGSRLPPNEKSVLFELLAARGFKLKQLDHDEYYDFYATQADLKEYFKNDTAMLAHIEKIDPMITDKDPEVFLILTMLLPFTKGFGKLQHIHGLLTCAQVATRKNQLDDDHRYTFNPTVLSEMELPRYLQLLKTKGADAEVRERFCLTGAHWRVGDIGIESGKVNALIVDSIGLDKEDRYNTARILRRIAKVFPSSQLFLDKVKRQHAPVACHIFALDDLMHLFSVENFLREKNLFSYLSAQENHAEVIPATFPTDNPITILPAHLPLSMMRTKQSRALKTEIIPKRTQEEQQLIINKKGQTAAESVDPSFKMAPSSASEMNQRLDEKLYRMACHNLVYLTSNSLRTIANTMEQHTVSAFEARCLNKDEVNFYTPQKS